MSSGAMFLFSGAASLLNKGRATFLGMWLTQKGESIRALKTSAQKRGQEGISLSQKQGQTDGGESHTQSGGWHGPRCPTSASIPFPEDWKKTQSKMSVKKVQHV